MDNILADASALLRHLSHLPLFGLTLTLGVFWLCNHFYKIAQQSPLANPVLWSVALIGALLFSLDIPYARYFEGAQYIHILLGPATVALAVPLYRNFAHIRSSLLALMVTLILGSALIISLNIAIPQWLDAPSSLLHSLAPKSATAPVAMALAETTGGIPSLAAVFAILTGITGAVLGGLALSLVRVTDPKARGFAIGLVSHGIGTARQLNVNETAGAFAGLGMGLNALMTALLLPLLLYFLT